jgi:hypothetical protein
MGLFSAPSKLSTIEQSGSRETAASSPHASLLGLGIWSSSQLFVLSKIPPKQTLVPFSSRQPLPDTIFFARNRAMDMALQEAIASKVNPAAEQQLEIQALTAESRRQV